LFKDARIRTKLIAIAVVPVLGLAYLAGLRALDRRAEAVAASELRRLIDLGVAVGNTLHETQRERGTTAVFVSSTGRKFVTELSAQRTSSDQSIALLRALVQRNEKLLPASVRQPLRDVFSWLNQLPEKRQRAQQLQGEAKEFIAYYTELNTRLLTTISSVGSVSNDAEIGRSAFGYVAFLNAKEKTGIERAQLANAFSNDRFSAGQLVTVASLLAAQDTFLKVFQSVIPPSLVQSYQTSTAQPVFTQVKDLEQRALDRAATGAFGVDPQLWFATMTRKMDTLKQLEDQQAAALRLRSEAIEQAANRAFVTTLFLCLVLLGITVSFTVLAVRDILRPLGEVITVARGMAAGDIRCKVEYQSSNELGALAESFREVAAYIRAVSEVVNALSRGDLAASLEPRGEADVLGHAVATLVTKLRELVQAMQSAGTEIGSSSQTMSTVSSKLSDSAQSTFDDTNSLSAAGVQMHATIADIARNAAEAATAATDMSNEVGTTSAKIAHLDEASREISQVLGLITNIANETKMLALNATIEAARAGAAGKGFAVVAVGVKDLAKNTAHAVDTVRARIAAMQTDAVEAVTAIGAITSKVKRVTAVTETIATAVAAQTLTTGEIGGRMHSVVSSASATQEAARHTADVSQEMLRLAGDLGVLVSRFQLNVVATPS
jgi:methyl-accepting chemotaxis protein